MPKAAKKQLPPDPAVRAFNEAFRRRLKEMREEAGLTQEQLCELIGVPLANYKHMEGKRASKFPLHKFEKLALALRQSCDYILTGRNSRMSATEHGRRAA